MISSQWTHSQHLNAEDANYIHNLLQMYICGGEIIRLRLWDTVCLVTC